MEKEVFVVLRGPWFFVALRGKRGVLRGPSWPFVFFVVLRGKRGVLRGPSWFFVALRGKRGVVLRGPSWKKRCSSSFVVLRVVLRGPSWPFVEKEVFFVVLRGSSSRKKRCSSWSFVVLRGPSWKKRCSSRLFACPPGSNSEITTYDRPLHSNSNRRPPNKAPPAANSPCQTSYPNKHRPEHATGPPSGAVQ